MTTVRFGGSARPAGRAEVRGALAWLVREWRELAHLPAGLRSKGKA